MQLAKFEAIVLFKKIFVISMNIFFFADTLNMLILVTNFIDFLYLSPSTLLLSLILSKSKSSLCVQGLNVQYRGKTFEKKNWKVFISMNCRQTFLCQKPSGINTDSVKR